MGAPFLPPPNTPPVTETQPQPAQVPTGAEAAVRAPAPRAWLPRWLGIGVDQLERQPERVGIAAGTFAPASDASAGANVQDDASIRTPQMPSQGAPKPGPGAPYPVGTPAGLLAEVVKDLHAIALALDPAGAGGLGMGVSTARTASSAGPQRFPLAIASQLVLPQNRNRRGLSVFHENPSAAQLFLCYGSIASPLQYTVNIPGGGLYELPPIPLYIGEISVACSVATGAVLLTELE